ncbi:MAG: sugar transferase [Paludibacter sp.]|nr:sugar transferase [Paludibacter sp.]
MNKNTIFRKYILFDMMAAFIVWFGFVIFRKAVNDIEIFDSMRILIPKFNYFSSLILFPIVCVFVYYLSGFYLSPIKKTKISLVFNTLSTSIIISISVFFILKLGDVLVSYKYFYFSLLVLFSLLFFVTFILRNIIFTQIQNNFKTKKWTINTLIIGTGENAKKIAADIHEFAPRNTLVGFISTNQHILVPKDEILGNMSQISEIIEKYDIKESYVILDNAEDYQIFNIINSLYKFNIDIRFTPRLYEILTGSAKIAKLELNPLVSITDSSMPDWQASLKRFSDIVLSFIALTILFPILVYLAVRIKADSKGPIFYKQERIGRFGLPFNILKFRTMFLGSENGVPKLSSSDDERITSFGRILRKYRLDEIPQFWNILKGDMSLVGPRPERKFYINQIIDDAPYYCLLYKIRPGLTSWGPIKIGYSDSIEKMIERLNFDIIYMENMSLLTDIKIMIYTIEIIFKGKGV